MDGTQFSDFEPPFRLSDLEARLIQLAQDGRGKNEIAAIQGISPAVIGNSLRNVAEKIRLFAEL